MDFKIGDMVRCLPGFVTRDCNECDNAGGYGYAVDKEFIIGRITMGGDPDIFILWPEENDRCGVYSYACTLVHDQPRSWYGNVLKFKMV